jgi:hypothetical protein
MTYEQDRQDLVHHEVEIASQTTFNYAVLDADETELLGCVYIDPPELAGPVGTPEGSDAVVSWWVVDRCAGSELERALAAAVPRWLADTWRFRSVHFH